MRPPLVCGSDSASAAPRDIAINAISWT